MALAIEPWQGRLLKNAQHFSIHNQGNHTRVFRRHHILRRLSHADDASRDGDDQLQAEAKSMCRSSRILPSAHRSRGSYFEQEQTKYRTRCAGIWQLPQKSTQAHIAEKHEHQLSARCCNNPTVTSYAVNISHVSSVEQSTSSGGRDRSRRLTVQ